MIACTPPYKAILSRVPPLDSTGCPGIVEWSNGRLPCDQSTDRSVRQNRFLVPHNLELAIQLGQFVLGQHERRIPQVVVRSVTLSRSECLMDEQATGNQGSGHQFGESVAVEESKDDNQIVGIRQGQKTVEVTCDQPRGDLVSGGQLGGGVESSGGNVYGVDSPASGCQPDGILTQPTCQFEYPPGWHPFDRVDQPLVGLQQLCGGRFGVLLVPPSTVVVTHRVVSPGSRSKL